MPHIPVLTIVSFCKGRSEKAAHSRTINLLLSVFCEPEREIETFGRQWIDHMYLQAPCKIIDAVWRVPLHIHPPGFDLQEL